MNEMQIDLTLVNQWTQQYQQLHDVLNSEKNALEKKDFNVLKEIVIEKNSLVLKINSEQIPAIIRQGKSNQSSISQPSFKDVQQYCLVTPTLKQPWEKLMTLVDQCRYKNEVNARIVELITESTKRTFNLIKGFDPSNNIYDAKGGSKLVKHYGQPLSA